ncbi:MAG: alkaline phosphatase family protein [Candidatus Moduliflexus flocculans]|nr:alkaline phosphatase family protein [Candidatus Moduliflexus flocculans]
MLEQGGDFRPLGTSLPPQTPVAWSNFITGMDPGGHAIFDFFNRDPKTYVPVFSATETSGAAKTVRIGKTVIPLSGGQIRNLRKGRAFWQILEDAGIPATVFKMPSNYPPVASKQRTLAGMNTPDLKGSYGIFSYYTNAATSVIQEAGGGGRVHDVFVVGNRVEAELPGPVNTFRTDAPEATVPFQVFLDPETRGGQDRHPGPRVRPPAGRVERLEARPLRPHPDPERPRHLPLLPQGGPAQVQALRLAHPHGPGPAGPAHLDAGVLRAGARAPLRALFHQGPAGRHERPRERRPRRGGVPDPRQHGLRGEHGHARVRARAGSTRACSSTISPTPTSASTCSGA